MQRAPHRCPHCSEALWIHNDMWGPYYLCEDCGWTAEDDDDVTLPNAAHQGAVLASVMETTDAVTARTRPGRVA